MMIERSTSIHDFVIVEPPTSQAVADRATEAWSNDPATLEIDVLHERAAEDDLPQLTERVSFIIKQMRRNPEGDTFIGGTESDDTPVEERSSYQVRTDPEPDQPARLTIIRPY